MTQIPAFPAPVIDSLLPQTANGFQPPVAAGSQPSVVSPPAAFGAGNGAATDPFAPPTPPPVDELTQLSQSLGIDITGFSTPEDARRAVQMVVERYAASGMNGSPAVPEPPAPPPQHQAWPPSWATTQQPSQAPVAEPLESAITDPKVLKHIEDLRQRVAQAEARDQQRQAEQEAAYSAQVQELERRTDLAIDKLANSKYGVAGQKSFSQQVSRENLKRLAGSIILGMQNVPGQRVPLIEQVVALAAFYDGGGQAPVPQVTPDPFAQFAPAPQPQVNSVFIPSPVAPVPQFSQPVLPSRQKPITNEIDYYKRDSQYMEGAKALLRRGRTS